MIRKAFCVHRRCRVGAENATFGVLLVRLDAGFSCIDRRYAVWASSIREVFTSLTITSFRSKVGRRRKYRRRLGLSVAEFNSF